MSVSKSVADRAHSIFQSLSQGTETGRFNPFDAKAVKTAALIGLEMAIEAEKAGDDDGAIDAVLNLAEARANDHPAGLVQHGLAIFATHSALGRLMGKPRLHDVDPRSSVPGRTRTGLEAAFGPEAVLDYWRENALANEHHQHWHEVYPSIGVLRPISEIPVAIVNKIQTLGWDALSNDELRQVFRPQDRHGELFVYMHQQMLARYDSERLSHGLEPVEPLDRDNLTTPIPEGFAPGSSLSNFDDRPADAVIGAADAAALGGVIANIRAAISNGAFENFGGGTTAITPTLLGDQIEAVHPIWRGNVDQALYGNLHNSGHGAIGQIDGSNGVMLSTATAIRDPVFYRWHKLIDDLAFEWQETRTPLDLSDAPPVRFGPGGDGGIILLNSNHLGHDAADVVETLFGGAGWVTAVDPGIVAGPSGEEVEVLDTIATKEAFAQFPDPDAPGQMLSVSYLAHDPVSFAFRLENTSSVDQGVTIRLFLAPEDRSEDRRFWIELDKVPVVVPAVSRIVVLRHDRESAVVKKPAEAVLSSELVADVDGDPRCDCGWPYTLLYPRGTEAGMRFRLMAVLTDAALDSVTPPGTCGSLSFCGARDAAYPDQRDMGYPFHVPWSDSISAITASTPSISARDVTIKYAPFGFN